jgi:hypothetical protein
MKSMLRLRLVLCSVATILLLTLCATTTGCSKKVKVDTVNLEYSFQTAEQSAQDTVNGALDDIAKANYSAALEKLKKVSEDPKLTAEQKTALTAVIAQLESR